MAEFKAQNDPSEQKSVEKNQIRTVEAESLLQGEKQILISHSGENYRLIVTRNNRLILQK
ncbi:MAG: hemin uptake protein HemP [Lacipirellulaceae bacterium]